uniref:Uncharacterized protein n=1 Tax=Tanacetum cinerariifolium TaxID=118510 RepID=A0A699IG66_TANCI|nr:hypothetical protein [Tanacetum cinerariifolium]GEZ63040.1 hypothetical protein [Tanacetum cinerariifolium]
MFDFPMDEPHPAYDFFTPGVLPSYAGNPNNIKRWIEANVPLLGELGEMGGEQVVVDVTRYTTSDASYAATEHLRGNVEYGHGLLVKKVITVSDAEVLIALLFGRLVLEFLLWRIRSRSRHLRWFRCLSDIYVESDSRHLEIIMIGCTGLGTKDCNSWGNFGFGKSFARKMTYACSIWKRNVLTRMGITLFGPQTYLKVVGKMARWFDDEIPRNHILTLRMDLLGVARFPRWVEAKVQPMAIKKTSFPEMESGG